MAGPGIRYFEMAINLSLFFKITLLVPSACDIQPDSFSIIPYNPSPLTLSRELDKLTLKADYVIAQNLPPLFLRKLKKRGIKYIADLYDPLPIEILEYTKGAPSSEAEKTFSFIHRSFLTQLVFADHILYATERQRDYYLGLLSALKVLNPEQYREDTQTKKLMTALPFGLDNETVGPKDKNFYHERFPAIAPFDTVLLWGGGIWNWFDPLTVIKAVEKYSSINKSLKLVFLGTKHPNPKVKEMEMATKAVGYARDHNLIDHSVFFNFGWTPYAENKKYLAAADIGVTAHFLNLENDFSFRTRVLGYLWAELPIITTKGDFFADLVEKENLGIVVSEEDDKAYSLAIETLVSDQKRYENCRKNITNTSKRFKWSNLVQPLIEKIENGSIQLRPAGKGANTTTLLYYVAGINKKLR